MWDMIGTQHGNHQDLLVRQKAMRLAGEVHRVAATFPRGKSQAELDTQLRLARDFRYLSEATFSDRQLHAEEIGRLLTAVIPGPRRRQDR